jgi:hypothetical protein
MSLKSAKLIQAPPTRKTTTEETIRMRVRALEIPPIKDGVVIGRDAAMGGEAIARTLRLMTHEKFERIVVRDSIIAELVVRSAIERKVGRDRLVKFVMSRIKPIMADTELLLLDIEIELVIEDTV